MMTIRKNAVSTTSTVTTDSNEYVLAVSNVLDAKLPSFSSLAGEPRATNNVMAAAAIAPKHWAAM